MSRFEKWMVAVLAVLIIGFALLEATAPQPTDWSPSFSRYHMKPYGGRLVYERLSDLFPEVRAVHDPVEVTGADRAWDDEVAERPVNHIYINTGFGLGTLGTEYLLRMVEQGDHALIAAEHFTGAWADTLKLQTSIAHWDNESISDIRFVGEQRLLPGVFRFTRGFPGAHFTSYDTSRTRVLAVDGASRPVLVQMAYGLGRIVLCTAPRALSNYNLVKDRNATFAAAALSVLPHRPVIWDEYYKVGRQESPTFMRFVLKERALRWAWFLAQALLLLFVLVYVRRQQRAIPVVAPPRNASQDLARTIGRLYWHKADHADLARKMIMHFKEEVRARTYLRTFAYDEPTTSHLAAKTGLQKDDIQSRLAAVARRESASRLSEKDLVDLSNELHDFRKHIP
ncbi:MAG: hypothetical protein IPM46_05485 [Flavobacteriales bacterium]|nr:hypothetical protein [Flavobacteriales bacterium]